nr:zf-CCHC domain-containing protein/DUF4219 domain-containing protein/UBN2 domain-containing protein [Tanacetum cinerariifolium]
MLAPRGGGLILYQAYDNLYVMTGLLTASKDLKNLIESQISDKNKEGLGYSVVPPPIAQIYSSPKKDLSWTGLPEFADDTITDYSRPSPTVEKRSTTNKVETVKKPSVRYAELYRKPSKKSTGGSNGRQEKEENFEFLVRELRGVEVCLLEKWLTFSRGLRNANHTQTLDLADIYGRFVYEDNLIQRRYSDTKKALITTPPSSIIFTAFFSNDVIQDFQENSDDKVDERYSGEYPRDLDVEYQERAMLANSKRFIKRRNNFLGQKVNENTECYKCGNKAKETWTDLVHSFQGPSDTKENRIMDLKLEYQTFRTKFIESLSQTYTRYKTLLNELANDGVNLSKHKINDFQENYDDEVDERYSEEYPRDLDVEYQERAMLANSKCFIKRRNNFLGQKVNENTECYKCGNKGHFARDCFSKTSNPSYQSPMNNFSSVSKGFQPKFTPKIIQSSPNLNSQTNPKFQKDYKAKYKKMKAKLTLLEASLSSPYNPKTFQPKNKGLVAKIFDWDEEEVDEEVTRVKVLMALADDELNVGKSHARNGEWVDITIRKVNTLLSMDENADWQNYLKYINIDLKFVKEQRLNLLSKYNKIVFELNKYRDELLSLKQAKLDAITF